MNCSTQEKEAPRGIAAPGRKDAGSVVPGGNLGGHLRSLLRAPHAVVGASTLQVARPADRHYVKRLGVVAVLVFGGGLGAVSAGQRLGMGQIATSHRPSAQSASTLTLFKAAAGAAAAEPLVVSPAVKRGVPVSAALASEVQVVLIGGAGPNGMGHRSALAARINRLAEVAFVFSGRGVAQNRPIHIGPQLLAPDAGQRLNIGAYCNRHSFKHPARNGRLFATQGLSQSGLVSMGLARSLERFLRGS